MAAFVFLPKLLTMFDIINDKHHDTSTCKLLLFSCAFAILSKIPILSKLWLVMVGSIRRLLYMRPYS